MRAPKVAILNLALTVALIGVAACAPSAPPPPTAATPPTAAANSTTPKSGGTLRIAFSDWPKNLHAQIDSGTEGLYVQVNITDGLLNIDSNGKIVPGLAVGIPDQPDNVTFIFHLRSGLKFQNGQPLTAKDVVWTFDRLLGKFEGQQSTQAARFEQQVKSVEALDDTTVKITLKQPWVDFLPMMAADKYMDILNKDAVTSMGIDYGITGVIGTGAFKLKEWIKGDHITITKNPDYWGKPLPYLDAITYKAIPDQSARLISFKSGETDLLYDPPLKDLKDLAKDPTVQVQTCDSGTEVIFFVNTTKPPFDKKEVRQALFYGIDRQAVMDGAYYGYFAKGQGIFPAWHWAYDPKADFYAYDPQKAKQLLAAAGFSDSKPLTFEIVTGNASEYVDVSTLIQAQLAQIGVKVQVTPLEAAAFTAKTFQVQGKPNPNFQAGVYRLKFSNLTTDLSWRMYSSKTALNMFGYNMAGGYQDLEVDKLLDQSVSLTNQAEAVKVNQDINRKITDDAVLLNLGWIKIAHVYRNYVKGVGCFVRDDFPLTEVWLDK